MTDERERDVRNKALIARLGAPPTKAQILAELDLEISDAIDLALARARCLFLESGFANQVGCDSRCMLGNEAGMDDATLFGRSSGASACAVRVWRDDPLDW